MFISKNNLYILFILFFLILISSLIWNLIYVPNPDIEIIGQYKSKNHHSLNDPLRYLSFVLIPSLGFIFFKTLFEKKKIFFETIQITNLDNKYSIKKLFIIFLSIMILLILEFLSITFQTTQIDLFHEGQKLSSAYKSIQDNSLWSGSFHTTGIILESLGTKIIWSILGNQSIGSMRYVEYLYIFLFKMSLILLVYESVKKTFEDESLRIFLFLVISFFSFFLIDYNIASGDNFSFRDLPILISLIIFVKYLNNNNPKYYIFLILGFLSIVSFFWSIDRALIVNFLIIYFCFILLINKNYFNFLIILSSTILSWLFFMIYLNDEFIFFLDNTYLIFKNINYIFGIIHPTPFSAMPDATRATKSLLLILFSVLISLSFFFEKKNRYPYNFKIIMITLSITCFFSYIYALGRTDGGHIKQTTGILYLYYLILIFFNIIYYLKKNFHLNQIILRITKIGNFFILVSFLLILKINFINIFNYSSNLNNYFHYEDQVYLSENQNKFVNKINKLLGNYNCIQLFTYDAALPYLLKKPNCTKYYYIYSVGTLDMENKMINEMKSTNIIIYSGETDNWGVSPKEKLPIVDAFVKSNYPNKLNILNWEIKFK